MSLTDYFVEGVVTGTLVIMFVVALKIIHKYAKDKK